jgi:uncharacterized protein (TIGR03437 family)
MKLLPALVLAFVLPIGVQAQCTYTVAPTTISVAASGISSVNPTKLTVTTQDGCAWAPTVPSTSPWVHVGNFAGAGSSGNNATGTGYVTVYVDANPNPVTRGGTLSIGGQVVTVAQAGANCSYTLSATTASFTGAGGPGSVQLQTTCTWGAGTTQSWITVPSGTAGSGNATVGYNVGANPCTTSRSGALVVGYPGTSSPQYLATLAISQDGAAGALIASPASLSVSNLVTDGTISITAASGCGWAASSDVSWVQLAGTLSGSGPGQIAYHILANTNVARTGNIHIGPVLVPVTQQAVAAPAPQLTAVKNAASYASDSVSPGEIVALGGTNIGPTTPATLQLSADGKSVTKSLGGVQVLFDGTPAALIYASAGQVNAVVPYGVAGKTTTQVQIQYNNGTSAAFSMPVQAATPAIFTQDASGLGPGAILNQSYQLNSSANRAGRGEAIMIYCTGGGVTDPASLDAAVTAAPYPQLTLPVSVTIGGVDAPVLYSGAAPGAIAGLTQINATVPASVTPGTAVPIVVKIGNWTSQNGVTVAVK